MPRSTLTDLPCELVHETDKAWLLDFGDNQSWVPKSIGELELNPDGVTATVTLPERWATENGLV